MKRYEQAKNLISEAEKHLQDIYSKQEEVEFYNSNKVLEAFK